jgi:hypothetical protein
MRYKNIREEELKNNVAQDYFWLYDCKKIIGNVDFCVSMPQSKNDEAERQSLLWAEAKKGSADIYKSLVQVILTIGKARTFDKFLPPAFLGAFDGEKIAFIPYNEIQEVFYLNDFNWNVAPSNHDTKEFKFVYDKIMSIYSPPFMEEWTPKADGVVYSFNFLKDDAELKRFIKNNFADKKFGISKIKIDKNNFISVYGKWLDTVKRTISVNWEAAKKIDIMDGDFYLADLLSSNNETFKEKLFVLLKSNFYKYNKQTDDLGEIFREAYFTDAQKAHTQFWNRYERPPKEDYWDYIINRRDLLVPQDIRERKGSFFTPKIWVELSQKYLADTLGEDWQDEYYVWDCCAGTGNLLAGLTNKYNIWASTLDMADVDVMKDRIENGANLLESHVFQFDFLNDDFTKLPKGLQNIINDEKKRKKLVVYINPPYAETMSYGEKHKAGLNQTMINQKYISKMGSCANRELYAQFLTRINCDINGCWIANFSKLKNLQAPNFSDFRNNFQPKLEKLFLVSANTFDNVKGKFPIGFYIWNTAKHEKFKQSIADVFNKDGNFEEQKTIHCYDEEKLINEWIVTTRNRNNEQKIGFIACLGNDFQTQNLVFIMNNKNQMSSPRGSWVTDKNLIEVCIYFTVRKIIPATWLNDRDQFLYPNEGWKNDLEFQHDCLAYTLFNNNIQSKYGVNHWIPFSEYGVGAKEKFACNFMTDFINGKLEPSDVVSESPILYLFDKYGDDGSGGGAAGNKLHHTQTKREFSGTAKNVLKAGGDLWRHYHQQKFDGQVKYNVNASLYDIREYFQKRNEKGILNAKSIDDEIYNELIDKLRSALKLLAEKVEPKVYEYGFLKN